MPVSSLKDLWRSAKRFSLSMIAAMLSFSIVAFTMALGNSLGVYIGISTLTRASAGFRGILSAFVLITLAFSVLVSLVVFGNLTATIMSVRAKDIAVLKTSGGSIHKIYSHFMTQAIQLSFLVGVSGIGIGILLYGLGYLIATLFFSVQLWFSIPILEMMGILAVLVICTSLFSRRHVIRAARSPIAESLSPQIRDVQMLGSGGWLEKRISKPGSPLRVAFRNTRRTKPFTLRLATCIFLAMILTTSVTIGGVIGDQTTTNYIQRALSEQFIFVGHNDVWNQYSSMVGFQASLLYNDTFNYQRADYGINGSIVNEVSLLPGVEAVDPRIISETQLNEVKVPVYVDGQYKLVGDNRQARVLVSGVKPENVISDWLMSGRFLNSSLDENPQRAFSSIVIGDSLEAIFDDTSIQKARLFNHEFVIVGTVLDPVYSGNTVYMLYNVTGALLGSNVSNMMLVKCVSPDNESTLSLIQDTVSRYGLSAFQMRATITGLINFVHSAWLVAFIPAVLLLLTMFLSVVGYMNLAFETGKRDFGIMRGIGASPKRIRRTVLLEGIVVSIWPGIAGILFGLMVSLWLLVPAATGSPLSVVISIVILLIMLFLASVIASIVSARASRKPVAEILR